MRRQIFFVYGVAAHLMFLVIYAWLAGFVGNLLVPHSIDFPAAPSTGKSVLFDIGLIVIVFEERNLITQFGSQYEEYRRQVPMFVPWRAGRRAESTRQPAPARQVASELS